MRAPKINTEIRQEQIAEAAIELIAAEGVNSLSIAGIAESGRNRPFGFLPAL